MSGRWLVLVHVSGLVLVGTVHADLDGFDRISALLQAFQPDTIAIETSAARAALLGGRFGYDAIDIYRKAHVRYLAGLRRYSEDPAELATARRRLAAVPVDWSPRHIAALEAGARLLADFYGFELKVAHTFAERHPGTSIVYIDLPEEHLDPMQRAVSPESLAPSASNLEFFARNLATLEFGLVGFAALLRDLQDAYYDEASGILRRRYEHQVENWHQIPASDEYRRAMFDPRREPHMAAAIRAVRDAHPRQRCLVIAGATHLVGLSRRLARYRHTSLSLFEVDVLRRALAA
jgi:hypothetical protein